MAAATLPGCGTVGPTDRADVTPRDGARLGDAAGDGPSTPDAPGRLDASSSTDAPLSPDTGVMTGTDASAIDRAPPPPPPPPPMDGGTTTSGDAASMWIDGWSGPRPGPGPTTTPPPQPLPGGTGTIAWHAGCWSHITLDGYTGWHQAIDFQLVTTTPVVIEGSLFASRNCDASASYFGADNMNDYGMTTPSTHMVQGFRWHPDLVPSSAIYWVGPRTADGLCPPGAPCSGCINYDETTPSCDVVP